MKNITIINWHQQRRKAYSRILLGCAVFLLTVMFGGMNIFKQGEALAVNPSIRTIAVGQRVDLNGSQFVKLNSEGLLMMTSTFNCPHGKEIAGQWAYCYDCDHQHGYFDYNNVTCACESGYNYRQSDHACLTCPSNSSWSTGDQVCQCSANYYMQGDNASCQSCPANSTSDAGSTSINACRCNANYYKSDNTCQSCPANSTSSAGSTSINSCNCIAGYYKSNNTCQTCPAHSSSSAGSTSINQCRCENNYYMSNGACVACPTGSFSPSGSTSVDSCVCPIGYTTDSGTNTCVVDTTNYSTTLDAYYDDTNCSNPVAWMDSWGGCVVLDEFDSVCLLDRRDHRTYRVRKFTNDQCWMIDSLRLGGNYGQPDGCNLYSGEGNFTYAWCGGSSVTGCTRGGAANASKAQETFSTGYYGHCRAVNSSLNNYLYDWVGAMQSTLAYYGSATTFTGAQQGICPSGWHLPIGGSSGNFFTLDDYYNNDAIIIDDLECPLGLDDDTCEESATPQNNYIEYFWTDSNYWNGTLSGMANQSSGSVSEVSSAGNYWTGTSYGTSNAYYASIIVGHTYPSLGYTKHAGLAVRCIQD